MKNTREIGSQTGTTKVSIVPLISATTPNSVPTAFVTGTSIVSIQPAAPAAMGLPLLILTRSGISMIEKTSFKQIYLSFQNGKHL